MRLSLLMMLETNLLDQIDNKFKIETTVPIITPIVLNDGLDTGLSSVDRATTVLKPNFSFNSESGLRVFIDRLMDDSYSGPIQNGLLVEGNDYTVTDDDGNYSVVFLTDFPDATQGSYTVMVEDDAGNRNIVPNGSTENLIRVDNLEPLIEYQKIDSTGRVLELKFNEELDLNPEIGDISLSLLMEKDQPIP